METQEYIFFRDEFKKLNDLIESLFNKVQDSKKEPHRSTEINDITSALSLAFIELSAIKPNKESIDGDFADISEIMKRIAPSFSKFGLKLYQHTTHSDDGFVLKTEIIHKSGQWISSTIKLILASTDKETGAHLDFHKRHQALTLLGIYPHNGTYDDNGDSQSEKSKIKGLRSNFEEAPQKKHWETITKEQYEDLMHTLKDYPRLAKDVMERYDISSLKDMPKKNFIEDMDSLRKIIRQIERMD